MKPVALIVLDGFGEGKKESSNPVFRANMPHMRSYSVYPHTLLGASEEYVGLEKGQMGSSEVGHLTMGAGRIILQTPSKIKEAIRKGELQKNSAFVKALEHTKESNSALHLMGLMSESGVHSFMQYAYVLLRMAKAAHLEKVYIHWFGDGRDAPPTSGKHFLTMLEKEMRTLKIGTIATMMGRYYAMDRDNRWDRTQLAYEAIMSGKGAKAVGAREALVASYEKDITDEFILPTIIGDYKGVQNNDTIIFFNHRADRARQITKAIVEKKIDEFKREQKKVHFVAMTQYYPDLVSSVAFPQETYPNILPEVLAKHKRTQLHAAETEKYAHVTFFFNGGKEKTYPGEDRILVPSPKVATYDLKPEMSAYELTESVVNRIHTAHYDFVLVNFANPDMVGHTGKMGPTIKALETVDICVKKIVDAIVKQGGAVLLTADHGNCEMISDTGVPHTSHTLNKVPCYLIVPEDHPLRKAQLKKGTLGDIAPTILEILDIPKPKEMTCTSLLHTL